MLALVALASHLYAWDSGWSVRGCNAERCRTNVVFYERRGVCDAQVDGARKNYPSLKFECVKALRVRKLDGTP